MTRRHLLGCIVLTAFAGAAAPAAADYHDTIDETFQAGRGGTLYLDTDRGSITVRSWSRNEVAVSIEREARDDWGEEMIDEMTVDMETRGDDVHIDVDVPSHSRGFLSSLLHGWNGDLRISFEITVPANYNLDIRTSGGSIDIDDLTGTVTCRTSGGSIKLNHIDGPVNANTSGGSIKLQSSTGNAELRTSGGSIKIGDVGGSVDAKTSGGGITIDRSAGPVYARTSGGGITVNDAGGTVDASTSGGSVTAYISRQPDGDCRLSTSGGSVTVYVDPASRLSIDAHTSGGGVSAEGLTVTLGKKDKNNLVADMNGGGPELNLRSSGGGVRIRTK